MFINKTTGMIKHITEEEIYERFHPADTIRGKIPGTTSFGNLVIAVLDKEFKEKMIFVFNKETGLYDQKL